MQRLWRVLLGKDGEFEQHAIDHSLLSIRFGATADLSQVEDRDGMLAVLRKLLPTAGEGRLKNYAAQINQFVNTMQIGDLVVVPLRTQSTIGVAEVTGPYQQIEGGYPARPVRWLTTDLQRETFRQDLLYSFGAIMTVCEVQRNDALNRVLAVLRTGRDSGFAGGPVLQTNEEISEPPPDEAADDRDPETIARDQIAARISTNFTGHELTRLVAAILNAQGYQTHISPPGPDNGIDIVAGQGVLGLQAPRLVVQVKSGTIVVDAPTLQSLKGCIDDTEADHALLVSWGGFRSSVVRQTNDHYFKVRLWNREALLDALLAVYDRLPEDIRKELPLQRIWTLIPDEDVSA